MSSERRGLAECASSAAAFGSVGVLVALAQHEHVGTTTLLASRYALGAIALWLVLLGLRRPLPRPGHRARRRRARRDDVRSGLRVSTSPRSSGWEPGRPESSPTAIRCSSWPARSHSAASALSRRRTAALALAVSGVGLLVAGGGLGAINAPGALLAFGSATVYTAYVLASTALRERAEPLALSTLVATGAAGAFAAAHQVHGGAPVHTATAALAVVALALVPTAFAVSAFLAGLGRIGPSRASIASSLEPAVAVACGVLVLGERLVPVQFLGAGLVIAAVLAIELHQLPRIPVPPLPRIRLFPRLVPRLPRPD